MMADLHHSLTKDDTTRPLQPHHLKDLRGSGLSDETIQAAGIYSATREQVTALLERDIGPGLAFPYYSLNADPDPPPRIKPDNPPIRNGKPAKYLTKRGETNHLYVPRSVCEVLLDPGVPVLITEGEKKCLKANQEGFSTVGLSGVWNFFTRTDKGQREILPDFKHFPLEGRQVYIVFDSDAAVNKNIQKAENALSKALCRFGAEVFVVRLPCGSKGEKQGLDDFLIAGGATAFEALLGQAQPRRDAGKKEKPDIVAARLVKLVLAIAELFTDQFQEPYVAVEVGGHKEIWCTRSSTFKETLSRLFYQEEEKPPNAAAIADALNVVNGQARFDGPQHELHNRVARFDSAIWYDMTDPTWRAVRITARGWEIVDRPPILFRRYGHQAAQIEPARSGDPWRLFDFISIDDDATRLLLLVWLTSCLVPDIPHPVPVLHGPQGSGKSCIFRYLRRIVDPSELETMSFPRDNNELVQKLSHNWMALFDNVDTLQQWQSDTLCRAVTGEGFSKRELYTTDADFIYKFRRCVGLNGINLAATRPDLLDRSILIGIDRIPPDQRLPEKVLEQRFADAQPYIVGGLFDVLATAMGIEPEVRLSRSPRMADFTRWGCAIAEALGQSQEAFLKAYDVNIEQQNEEVLIGEPVAAAIVALMRDQSAWEGSPNELLRELESRAPNVGISTKVRSWPRAANYLTRRIVKVKPNLEAFGICIKQIKSGRRLMRITKNPENAAQSVQSARSLQDNDLPEDATGTLLDANENSVPVASEGNSLPDNELEYSDALDGKIQTSNRRKKRKKIASI